ncbi:hypothetical protein [Candidatus Solincola sp.]|nr:hypothetical protein [Actinomycetota bacterium]MDI7253084.1 hypothetical protein [Actinomycetota bacterium]
MVKKTVSLVVSALLLGAFFSLAGCGSADREDYFREIRKINEKLTSRLGELGEEVAALDHGNEEELKEDLAGILEETALILEEGVREMSRVRVPAGGEEAHLSFLELLSEAAAGYRESATALMPRAVEEHGHESGEEEVHVEEAGDHATQEGAEENHPIQAAAEEAGHSGGH